MANADFYSIRTTKEAPVGKPGLTKGIMQYAMQEIVLDDRTDGIIEMNVYSPDPYKIVPTAHRINQTIRLNRTKEQIAIQNYRDARHLDEFLQQELVFNNKGDRTVYLTQYHPTGIVKSKMEDKSQWLHFNYNNRFIELVNDRPEGYMDIRNKGLKSPLSIVSEGDEAPINIQTQGKNSDVIIKAMGRGSKVRILNGSEGSTMEFKSEANNIPISISTNGDGSSIEIQTAKDNISIDASNGNITINGKSNVSVSSTGVVTITSPNIILSGNVSINGNLNVSGNLGVGGSFPCRAE